MFVLVDIVHATPEISFIRIGKSSRFHQNFSPRYQYFSPLSESRRNVVEQNREIRKISVQSKRLAIRHRGENEGIVTPHLARKEMKPFFETIPNRLFEEHAACLRGLTHTESFHKEKKCGKDSGLFDKLMRRQPRRASETGRKTVRKNFHFSFHSTYPQARIFERIDQLPDNRLQPFAVSRLQVPGAEDLFDGEQDGLEKQGPLRVFFPAARFSYPVGWGECVYSKLMI